MINTGEKYCPDCKETKSIDDFAVHKAHSGGRKSHCKECLKVRERNRNRVRGQHPPKVTRVMKIIGVSYEEYQAAWDRQKGKYAICRKEETSKYKDKTVRRLAVDHNHKTGKFRALLCYRCNVHLHFLEDRPFIAEAQAYLDLYDS